MSFTFISNADAPTHDQNGELIFAKPWEEDQPFPEFLDYVRSQETDPSFAQGSEIRYAQTRQYEHIFSCHQLHF